MSSAVAAKSAFRSAPGGHAGHRRDARDRLFLDVRTDIAGQTALSAAVWLVLFYVLRGWRARNATR